MGFVAYKKDFEVSKGFNLAKFIRVLDKENFHPFSLHIEKLTEYQYELSFHHIKTPIFVTGAAKRNIGDEILLSVCRLQHLESVDKIRFSASINNKTITGIVLFSILFLIFPIVTHTILGWIPLVFFIVFQLLKYYWDIKRYNRIAQTALSISAIKKKSKGK